MDNEILRKALESGEPFAVAIAVGVLAVGAVRKWGRFLPWVGGRLEGWLKCERNVILLALVGAVGAAMLVGWASGAGIYSIIVAGIVAGLGAMGASTGRKVVAPNVKDKEIERLEALVADKQGNIDDLLGALRKKISEKPPQQRNEAARMAVEEELKNP